MARKTKKKKETIGADYQPRVIVVFHDWVGPLEESDVKNQLIRELPVEKITGQDVQATWLFNSLGPEKIQELVDRAAKMDPTYDPPNFSNYFAVTLPPEVEPEAVAKAVSPWRTVKTAYVEPEPVPPPAVNPSDDPLSAAQVYLDPAQVGIDTEYAWGFPGGDGQGIGLVDLETGWMLTHEDLRVHEIGLVPGPGLNNRNIDHGTAVLGIIAAADNEVFCVGITPNLDSIRVVGQWRPGDVYTTKEPIMEALAVMHYGDVLLLEAQTTFLGYTKVPVEIEPGVFDVIRLATALGIVVVESAGNGLVDLDTVVDASQQPLFSRSRARDSGAILVGAATSTVPHSPNGISTCHGCRIDCYAWGENVVTLSTNLTGSKSNFLGTSAAAAIIAGAALAVQGLAQANLGYRFSPGQLRAILSDPNYGTASANGKSIDKIGVMPDLRKIINQALYLTPDVYIRDFVGDTGDPHTGPISASPDIILRTVEEPDPQASFGEGSSTEYNNTLGSTAEAGQDNFLYVRVRNRGGSAATDVRADVYWSPPATLVTPDLWTHVDSVTIPTVPTGNVLTVSGAITWKSADIPATGHYCFVGLVGNAQDPAPAVADLQIWDHFLRFIRNNNNVTWRNFNVVDNVPNVFVINLNLEVVTLPFIAPGPPDQARCMQLEVEARLPEETQLWLEAPLYLLDAMQTRSESIDEERLVEWLPLNPHGRSLLGEALFPAMSRNHLQLLVNIPEDQRDHPYEVFVRQLYEGQEVGRITWRLVPPDH